MDYFLHLKTTQKGIAAEKLLLNEFVISKGYQPYMPGAPGPYPVDCIALSGNSKFNIDMKNKQRMIKFDYTGIDVADWDVYNNLSDPTYLLFADTKTKTVYGQWCSELSHQPSKYFGEKNRQVITWPLSGFTFYRELTDFEVSILNLDNNE